MKWLTAARTKWKFFGPGLLGGADEQLQQQSHRSNTSVLKCSDCQQSFTRKDSHDFHKKFRCPKTRGIDHLMKSQRLKDANRESTEYEIAKEESLSTTYRLF